MCVYVCMCVCVCVLAFYLRFFSVFLTSCIVSGPVVISRSLVVSLTNQVA